MTTGAEAIAGIESLRVAYGELIGMKLGSDAAFLIDQAVTKALHTAGVQIPGSTNETENSMNQGNDIPTINAGDQHVVGADAPAVEAVPQEEEESLLTLEQQQRVEAVAIAAVYLRRTIIGNATVEPFDVHPLIDLADYILTGCAYSAELVGDGNGQPEPLYDERNRVANPGLLTRTGIPPFAHGVVGRRERFV